LNEGLADTGLSCPAPHRSRFGETNASLFAVVVPDGVDRNRLRTALASRGIRVGLHYPLLADEPSWSEVRKVSGLEHSSRLAAATLTLPTSPAFGEEDCDRLVDAVRQALVEVGAAPLVAGRRDQTTAGP
jgi:dTDP-4-amino-4,6-dideoxygalactose transaminase